MTERMPPTPEEEQAKTENEFLHDKTGNVSKAYYAIRAHLLDNNLIDEGDLEKLWNKGGLFGLGRQVLHPDPRVRTVTEAGIMFRFRSKKPMGYEEIEDDTFIVAEVFASYRDPRDYNNNQGAVWASKTYFAGDITDEVIEEYKALVDEHFIEALEYVGLNKRSNPTN